MIGHFFRSLFSLVAGRLSCGGGRGARARRHGNTRVTPSDFVHAAGAVALSDAGRRPFIAAYERRMEQMIPHPLFGYTISYRRVLEVQARLLARVVTGEIDAYPSMTR